MSRIVLLCLLTLSLLSSVGAQNNFAGISDAFPEEGIIDGKFYGILDASEYPFEIQDERVVVKGVLSKNTFWVEILDVEQFLSQRRLIQPKLKYIVLKSEEKTSPLFKSHVDESALPVKVFLLSDNSIYNNRVIDLMESGKADNNTIYGKATTKQIRQIAELPYVQYVSPVFIQPKTLLANMYTMNRTNLVHNNTSFGNGFKGRGIKIGMWDGGMVNEHVDNTARLLNVEKAFYFTDFTRHATHVSGIINSKGHRNVRNVGMAPESFVFAYDFYGEVPKEMRKAVEQYNISITNNSFAYGDYSLDCFNSGLYIPEAAELDEMVNDHPELLHVVAVGNAAWNTSTNSFNCDGREWSYVEVGFQGAKNNITVGWLSNVEALWVGSSRGPTTDGRLKPELVTKGASVNSLNETNLYANRWGSSQASPAVAGIAALVQEAFKEKFGFIPKASTVKSILLNTARDMGIAGPDYRFGFGLVNADRAIETVFKGTMLEGSLSHNGIYTQNINIPANTEKFQLTLCWSDLPAQPPYQKILVNDLDLKIIGPGGVEYFPWVLNSNQPQLPATTGVDTLNNFEQITINKPSPGNYTIQVRGKSVAGAQQDFSIAYNTDEVYLKLTNPVGGEKFFPGEQVFICWDAEGEHASFNVQVSYNNGSTWSNLATNLASTRRYFAWTIPNATRSVQAKVRVTSNLKTDESAKVFTIMPRVGNLTRDRCDKALRIYWTGLTDATHYIVHLLKNDEYVDLGTTTATNFTITGLANGQDYWVSVTAVYNDTILAARSNGVLFRPAPIPCNFTNDLAVREIITPHSGRMGTSSQLTASEPLSIKLKNFGIISKTDPTVCFKMGSNDSLCSIINLTINAGEEQIVNLGNITGLQNSGNYPLRVWIKPTDDEPSNNSLSAVIKHLPNEPLTLPYFQDFEIDTGYSTTEKTYLLDKLEEYDFENSSYEGKLSVGLIDKYTSQGFGAVTLENYFTSTNTTNYLTLNLNLSNYSNANIYLDLSFLNHGNPNGTNDRVWVRGADNQPWLEVLKWGEKSIGVGLYTHLKALNLTRILKDNGQDYTSSFQVRFGQEGSAAAVDFFQNDGISIDNIAVYEAGDDIELSKVVFPEQSCKSFQVPLKVEVINHSYKNFTNVPVYFKYKGTVYQEFIPNLPALSTVNHTFLAIPDLSEEGLYEMQVYVYNSTDLYRVNDTIKRYIAVSPILSQLPNYLGFENEARLISTGANNNWQWGPPVNSTISGAAEGFRAWVTGLTKNYLNEQESYLYSPCYDLSAYNDSILLSFNLILQIERNYDLLTIEYTDNGIDWARLGSNGAGFNWFNASASKSIWDVNVNRWKVASQYIKKDLVLNSDILSFRFYFSSDLAESYEGAGIDDWHLTDLTNRINVDGYNNIQSIVPTGQVRNLISGNRISSSVQNLTASTFTVDIEQKIKSNVFYVQNKYPTLRRSWVIKSNAPISASKKLSLYFTDQEYESLIQLANKKAQNQLAVLIYKGINEDTSIINNYWNRNYTLINPGQVQITPHESGYFATFDTDLEGEFFVVIDPIFAPNNLISLNNLTISKTGCTTVVTSNIKNLPASGTLRLESSRNGKDFTVIKTQNFSGNTNTTNYTWIVQDNGVAGNEGLYYYRVSVNNGTSITYLGVEQYTLTCPCPFIYTIIDTFICPYDSIILGNKYYKTGIYMLTLTSVQGCDSFLFASVRSLRTENRNETFFICAGDSVNVNGIFYKTDATFTLKLVNAVGCDSIVNVIVHVDRADFITLNYTKCPEDSVFVGGNWLSTPGEYSLNYKNKFGCDSIITVNVSDYIADTVRINVYKCRGDSAEINDGWISTPGKYTYIFQSVNGCDSLVEYSLIDNQTDSVEVMYTLLCPDDSVQIDGQWYNEPDEFYLTKTGSDNCDSIVKVVIIQLESPVTTANFVYVTDKLNVQFNNLSSNSDSLLWLFGDGNSSNTENPLHTYNDYGIYQVLLKALGICNDDSLSIELILEENVEPESGIKVFPNPTSHQLNVIVSIPNMQSMKVRLVNLLGQVIFTELHNGEQFQTFLDVTSVSAGRYFLIMEAVLGTEKMKRYHYPVVIVR